MLCSNGVFLQFHVIHNTEKNNRTPKTSKQLIAELKNQELAKVVLEMSEFYGEEGLRAYQESIYYCIYALSVLEKESDLTEDETKLHITQLHMLRGHLFTMENIISSKNISHE